MAITTREYYEELYPEFERAHTLICNASAHSANHIELTEHDKVVIRNYMEHINALVKKNLAYQLSDTSLVSKLVEDPFGFSSRKICSNCGFATKPSAEKMYCPHCGARFEK